MRFRAIKSVCVCGSSLFVLAAMLAAQAAAEPVQWSMGADSNTAGLWLFKEGAGATVADEITGTANVAGTLVNAAWAPGTNYYAVATYPGYMQFNDNAAIRPATAITVEAWLKIEHAGCDLDSSYVIYKGSNYYLKLSRGCFVAAFYIDSSYRIVTGTAAVPMGRWTHLAMTYKRGSSTTGTITTYIDGALDTTTALSGLSTGNLGQSTGSLYIGRNGTGNPDGGVETDGKIAALRISNIARAFEPLAPQTVTGTDSGTAGLWRFTEGSGTTTANSIPGGSAGTLSGTTTWVAGQDSYAVDFNSGTGYVQIADSAALRPTSGITLEAWANLTTASGDLIGKNNNYNMRLDGGSVTAMFYLDGAWRSVTGHLPVPAGGWTHLAMSYGTATQEVAIWVNGVLDVKQRVPGLTVGSLSQENQAIYLGRNSGGSGGVAGVIDTFRISNVVRCFVPAPPTPETDGNLVPNGNFEMGLIDWRPWCQGDANLIWQSLSGGGGTSGGLQCMCNQQNVPVGSGMYLLSQPIAVIPDRTYTLSYWQKGTNTYTPAVRLWKINSTGIVYSTDLLALWHALTDSWCQYSGSLTIPADVRFVCVAFEYPASNPLRQFWVDDVRLQAGTSVQPLVLRDMITVAPDPVPTADLYTYTAGTTTATTLRVVNVDTVAHNVAVKAIVTDWQGGTSSTTVGTCNVAGSSSGTLSYPFPTNHRGAFRLAFDVTTGGQTWHQRGSYKYAVIVNLQGVGNAQNSAFGMNCKMERHLGSQANRCMLALAQCGVKWIRAWWNWGQCETQDPDISGHSYSFTEYDRQHSAISDVGMKNFPCLQRRAAAGEYAWAGSVAPGSAWQPPWNGLGGVGGTTDRMDDWGLFCGTVAARYSGSITAYECWNEPDIAYPDPVSAADYVRLLNNTKPNIAPHNAIVGGFGGPDSYRGTGSWMAQVLTSGTGTASQMDMVDMHRYNTTIRPELNLPSAMGATRTTMTYGGCPTTMPIWLSERGTSGDDDGYIVPGMLTEPEQAALYVRDFVTTASLGIPKHFWFEASTTPLSLYGVFYENYIPRGRLVALNACASCIEGLTWQNVRASGSDSAIYAHMFGPAMSGDTNTTALWRFTEGWGTLTANSVAGGPSGTLTGTATWVAGQDLYAVDFNSGNGYVKISDAVSLRPINAMTVEVWAKLNSAAGSHDLVSKGDGYVMRLSSSGKLVAYFFLDGTSTYYSVVGTTTVPTGSWTHLAISYSGSATKKVALWVDGVLDTEQSVSPTTGTMSQATNSLYLGRRSDGANTVSGTIDTCRISNVARTSFGTTSWSGTGSGACVMWNLGGKLQVTLPIATSKLTACNTMGDGVTVSDSGGSATFELPHNQPVFLTCGTYSDLNAAVGSMTQTATAISLAYHKNSSTSLTVTATNQSSIPVDGIVDLVTTGGTVSGWPAAQQFDSLAPGTSRTFNFAFTGTATTASLSKIRARVGDMFMQIVEIPYVETTETTVVGRRIFYNNSTFDGNDAAANAADDNAIATDKSALLPGGTASLANYTSYSRGINGIMIDFNQQPPGTLTAADFQFKMGNTLTPGTWSNAPAPQPNITVRLVNGVYRATIIWTDKAIKKTWLQVTVLANGNTGLANQDVFYFGNAIGETGNQTTNADVNSADVGRIRDRSGSSATVTNLFDLNRDGSVNSADVGYCRDNSGFSLVWLIAPASP